MKKQEKIILKTQELQATIQQAYEALNLYELVKKQLHIPTHNNIEKTSISEKELNYKMAAHDLISPLATQYTLLSILYEECMEAKERLNRVLQNAESIMTSNDESIKKSKAALNNNIQTNQPIPFKQLIQIIIQLLGVRELYKDVDIIVHHNTKKSFYNNIAMVQSIMQNLIQNAIKYSKPNQQNTITITLNDAGNGIEIIVQDTGIGMEKQRVNQLFKQVVQSHTNISHTHGFGLYGVAQYVEKLKGKITVQSTLHIGSTFKVYLPSLQ